MQGVIEEKRLLYRVKTKKDAEAFALLYDAFVSPIYRYVYFKISDREEAQDITSDVFLKAWQYLIGDGADITNFRQFVYTIARNCVIDVYRERAKKPVQSLHAAAEIITTTHTTETMRSEQDYRLLLEQIRHLKQEYQEVIMLRYVEDLDIGDIAAITGKSHVSVRVTLHRALKKMKSLLTPQTD